MSTSELTLQPTEKDVAVHLQDEGLIDCGLIGSAEAMISAGIHTEEDWNRCQQLNDAVKDHKKKIDAIRKLKVNPFNEITNAINGWFRPRIERLTQLEQDLGRIYATYYRRKQDEVARLQREADAKAASERKKLEKQQQKVQNTALFDDDIPTPPTPAPIPKYEAPKPTAPIQQILRVRILEPAKVPTKYKVPSEELLLLAHKAGEVKIPGVEFYTEDIVKRSRF